MNRVKEKLKNLKKIDKAYIIIFFLILLLAYFFPYTHDDWDWGSVTGWERLKNGFSNFNGRWAGNSLGMLLTRVRILRSLTIPFTMVGFIYFLQKIVNCKNKSTPYIAILLVLLMPVRMFAQSFAWTVGFANYVPPVLIALFIIYKNRTMFQENWQEISNKWIFPFLLLGFVGALFMEHLTIYLVVLGIALLLVNLIKKRKLILPNLFFFIGSIAGSIFMFSNTGYRTLFGEGDGYRSIEDGNFIIRAIKTYFGEFKDLLVSNNFILNTVLCILTLILTYQFFRKNKKNITKGKRFFLKFSSFILSVFLSYQFFLKMTGNSNPFITTNFKKLLEGLLILGYAMAIIIVIIIAIQDKEKRNRMLFEIGSIVMIAAPLLVVKPIGPRCFFPTYLFFVLLIAEFFEIVVKSEIEELAWMLKASSYTLIILYLLIYGYCFMIEQKRVIYMKNHKEDEVLVLPELPYGSFMQIPNPRTEWFRTQYRQFYGLEEDVTLEFINYKEWKKEYEK